VSRTCIVSFQSRGAEWYNVTAASTVFEAVRTAMRFFLDPFWKGPRPNAQTVFTVTLVGDNREWRVVGRAALKSELDVRSLNMESRRKSGDQADGAWL
jgi:hypothetical protein